MKNKVFPIFMTVLWGMTFATALHSLTLGICMGMMMGIAIGLFGSGMFYKNALVIAVPIMLQQLIQSLVSLIDIFMVSGLGDVSMSGVNVAGQLRKEPGKKRPGCCPELSCSVL